uniref:Major facilitator superfamily (MFS) profile domain-containing protein n=1 Tax=Chromera velia CCMP2878 TaxID=1169474 RepID=A0A0G4FTI3_9ALVE|eukprot:Cvel_18708.t1-p1 / transcript=Cvel_18708.t1 / gene=Cvel_18708 / organism=Chromera_velia_CCMP2878 / gene_product=Probable sphingolipid transporter spinster homolog, putative / transcript_product=Probable sphingolipid transporter spinster homolog, putative / location=Cvel_scaffold1568:3657-7025(+) / protein_length=673 / sequence_SO=supercontig / SO=protein_coding / is_pseudo=false
MQGGRTVESVTPSASSSCFSRNVKCLFAMLIVLNLLVYIDRGIIPGANQSFTAFVNETLNEKPDFFVGLLQSAFIAGVSISMLVFGHLVHRFHPFRLMSLGLFIWSLSLLLCALAGWVYSYWLLLFARMLSGVGEASFITIAPVCIMDNSKESGFWLALFYCGIPLGTAIGFSYGAAMGSAGLWPYAYLIEFFVSIPFGFISLSIPSHLFKGQGGVGTQQETAAQGEGVGERGRGRERGNVREMSNVVVEGGETGGGSFSQSLNGKEKETAHRQGETAEAGESRSESTARSRGQSPEIRRVDPQPAADTELFSRYDSEEALIAAGGGNSAAVSGGGVAGREGEGVVGEEEEHSKESIWVEIRNILSSFSFWLIAWGYASYSAVIMGLTTYGSPIMIGLGFYHDELEASTILGAVVSFAGIVGTMVGGWLLSVEQKHGNKEKLRSRSFDGVEEGNMRRLEEDEESAAGVLAGSSAVGGKEGEGAIASLETTAEDKNAQDEAERARGLLECCRVISLWSCIGVVVFFIAILMQTRFLFLLGLFLGLSCIFATQPGTNLAVMLTVPPQNRPLAVAMVTLLLHVLGDVPSPLVIAQLKSSWAPNCTFSADMDKEEYDEQLEKCKGDRSGLRWVLIVTSLWLAWMALANTGCLVYAQNLVRRTRQRLKGSEAQGQEAC